MSITNKFYPISIKGENTLTQTYTDNVSLRCEGRCGIKGDTYINNSGRLIINKKNNTTTNYKLDVSGDANITGNLLVTNISTFTISTSQFNTLNNIDTTHTIQNQIDNLIAVNIANINPDTIITNLIEVNGGPLVSEIYPISMNDGTI